MHLKKVLSMYLACLPAHPVSPLPPAPQPVVSEEFAIKMEASLKTWVSAWDSKGYDPDSLDKGE